MRLGVFTVLFGDRPLVAALDRVVEAGLEGRRVGLGRVRRRSRGGGAGHRPVHPRPDGRPADPGVTRPPEQARSAWPSGDLLSLGLLVPLTGAIMMSTSVSPSGNNNGGRSHDAAHRLRKHDRRDWQASAPYVALNALRSPRTTSLRPRPRSTTRIRQPSLPALRFGATHTKVGLLDPDGNRADSPSLRGERIQ